MHADTFIPRRLDDQWKLGLWDIDVAAPVLFSIMLGWLAGTKVAFAVLLGAGLLVARAMHRMKAVSHPAIVLHFLYWHLPPSPLLPLKATPPSSVERMHG